MKRGGESSEALRRSYRNQYVCDESARLIKTTDLHKAVKNDDAEMARHQLSQGTFVDVRDFSRSTPLHYAALNNNLEIVKLLLEWGAYVNGVNLSLQTPLHMALQEAEEDVYEEPASKSRRGKKQRDQICHCNAFFAKKIEIVEYLLAHGALVNPKDEHGDTPLHMVPYQDNAKMYDILLAEGACLHAKNEHGQTPLHTASSGTAVIRLFNEGADVNAVDRCGYTPLTGFGHSLVDNRKVEVLKDCVIMLRAADFFVCDKNLKLIKKKDEAVFQPECDEEIKRMKEQKILNTISFFDALRSNLYQWSGYAENESVAQFFKSGECAVKFPIYCDMLKYCFQHGIERNANLDKAHFFFQRMSDHPDLPKECVEIIVGYLSKEDLRICFRSVHIDK